MRSKLRTAQLRPEFQMIFQDPFGSLDPRRKVGWSIAEPLRAMGVTAPGRVAQAFEHVGLHPEDAGKYPHEFSGGQRSGLRLLAPLSPAPSCWSPMKQSQHLMCLFRRKC